MLHVHAFGRSEAFRGFAGRALLGLGLIIGTAGVGSAQATDSQADSTLLQDSLRRHPGNADVLGALFDRAGKARDWAKMVTYGRPLARTCEIAPVVPEDIDAGPKLFCGQLLTAYIATNRPALADALAARIRTTLHMQHESAFRTWYAIQLHAWGGWEGHGAAALIDSVLRLHPAAGAIHHGLLRDAADRIALTTEQCPLGHSPVEDMRNCIEASTVTMSAAHPHPEVWRSEPPPGTPFPRSRTITGIAFTGTTTHYTHADTWYPSWGGDDTLYSAYADGYVQDSAGTWILAGGSVGRAVIRGTDPEHLTVTALPIVPAPEAPYGGRYPAGNLMYHGIWYVGTYTLNQGGGCGNWCDLGPMVGFHWSADRGHTWHAPPDPVTPAHPLFGETAFDSARVKLSAAHFVDFGKEMQYSPDGKAYLVGHGSTASHSHNGWIAGDQIYLARVTPSPETINDVTAWEFYAGRDTKGRPRWSHSFADITPIVEWKDHLGNVAVTYDAPLRKYLLFTTHGWPSIGPFDTIVLEADQLTGPWRLVTYMKNFGPEAYFVNLPTKFISKDGRTAWLCYAANFWRPALTNYYGVDPAGSGYWMTLHKIRLLGPGDDFSSGPRRHRPSAGHRARAVQRSR